MYVAFISIRSDNVYLFTLYIRKNICRRIADETEDAPQGNLNAMHWVCMKELFAVPVRIFSLAYRKGSVVFRFVFSSASLIDPTLPRRRAACFPDERKSRTSLTFHWSKLNEIVCVL